MDLELDGKRALVTGGSGGIGLAVARALLDEGVRVGLVARGQDGLDRAVAELDPARERTVTLVADTSDEQSVRDLVRTARQELGGVDILVNTAARPASRGPVPPLAELSDDAVRAEFETKVLGYLRCARAVAPLMIEQGWGRIINVSGLNARQAGSLVGSVRNVAVAAMTKNLADELGPAGVNVTVVHPGTTVTDRLPGMVADRARREGVTEEALYTGLASVVSIGRLVTAAEVASVVAFLASPKSVAINGDAVAAGGGTRGAIHY